MLRQLGNLSRKLFTVLFPSPKPLLLSGAGSSSTLAALVHGSGHQRPLLVTERFLVELGLLEPLIGRLEALGCEVTVFDGVVPNPTHDTIEAGLAVGNQGQCDSVIAVGGGSAIDTAKVVAACLANDLPPQQVVGIRKIRKSPLPFYAVPTTSGTGSEVTNAAVISDPQTHRKGFVVDPRLIPAAAALDPSYLRSLPPHITAATGMDALTHAIEAYISLNQFADAERDAALAIRLLVEYLPVAYEDGSNLEAREMVALAAFLAGYAFNKSGLGYVHAISHQVSAHYNTPHGLANAILLSPVLRFNEGVAASRFAALERTLPGASDASDAELADRFICRIEDLVAALGIPSHVTDLQASDFDAITTGALKEARSLYAVPRVMSPANCKELLSTVTAATQPRPVPSISSSLVSEAAR